MPPDTVHHRPGATVQTTPSTSDIARIEELLSRLDPGPAACPVPGCLHLHVATGEGGAIALAA